MVKILLHGNPTLKKVRQTGCVVGSKTTDECGDEWRRVHTTGDEYIRVGIVQETSTYEWVSYRRRVHTSGYRTGDEYIQVPRGQETSTYDRRRVHTSA